MDPSVDNADGEPVEPLVAAVTRLRITLRAAAASGMSVADLAQTIGLSEEDVASLLDGD